VTGIIVEAIGTHFWSLNTDFFLTPLFSVSIVACVVLLEDLGSTEESTCGFISPLVGGFVGALTDLASWNVVLRQGIWNVCPVEQTECAALSGVWWDGVDVDLLSVLGPLTSLESLPFAVLILENVSTVMPVALIPRPLVLETLLGWTPVVISVSIPLVPDSLFWVPLPDLSSFWLGVQLTPVANLWVVWVLGYEVHACCLGFEDVAVLSIDLGSGLFVMSGITFGGVCDMGSDTVVSWGGWGDSAISNLNEVLIVNLREFFSVAHV
jgi:hypothetical protein